MEVWKTQRCDDEGLLERNVGADLLGAEQVVIADVANPAELGGSRKLAVVPGLRVLAPESVKARACFSQYLVIIARTFPRRVAHSIAVTAWKRRGGANGQGRANNLRRSRATEEALRLWRRGRKIRRSCRETRHQAALNESLRKRACRSRRPGGQFDSNMLIEEGHQEVKPCLVCWPWSIPGRSDGEKRLMQAKKLLDFTLLTQSMAQDLFWRMLKRVSIK